MIVDKPYYMNRRDNPNSSVNNREKVYCCNVEYDYIREILMKDPEIWSRFKYMYSLKKFHTYNFTLQRIGEQFKREYVQRISQEFKRAKENGLTVISPTVTGSSGLTGQNSCGSISCFLSIR